MIHKMGEDSATIIINNANVNSLIYAYCTGINIHIISQLHKKCSKNKASLSALGHTLTALTLKT